MRYCLERHGGNSNHTWRVIAESDDIAEILVRYEKEKKNLRQGGLRLYRLLKGKLAEIVADVWAPRLRSKW